jgi:5'(3')-deoxyribonucleotidase
MIIGIDCDGVLYPFTENFIKFASNKLKRELPIPTKWEMWQEWNITIDEWKDIYFDFLELKGLNLSEPYKDCQEVLKRLREKGHSIFIITHRLLPFLNSRYRKMVVNATIEFLEDNDIPYDDLLIMEKKFLVKTDILLDDALHNLNKCESIPICFNQPWNQNYEGTRVNGWLEFEKLVNELNGYNE